MFDHINKLFSLLFSLKGLGLGKCDQISLRITLLQSKPILIYHLKKEAINFYFFNFIAYPTTLFLFFFEDFEHFEDTNFSQHYSATPKHSGVHLMGSRLMGSLGKWDH
jgi:hypothetical protein